MIVIGEKISFIVRVLVNKIIGANIDCEFVPCTVDDISRNLENVSLITFFMEDSVSPHEDVIHYLVDVMIERGIEIILIGEQKDIRILKEHIPPELVHSVFSRPVDNTSYVNTVVSYFEKKSTGELKKSILVVDDDPNYLGLVREWLKDSYRVFMANSGMQAIKWLGKNRADLILLDHEMPVTSGPQVLEMLRSDEETRSIPVMFLTGKSDKESVMAVIALKPEGYFLKTIQREELLEKLREFFILHK